jgi:hypothetical protein
MSLKKYTFLQLTKNVEKICGNHNFYKHPFRRHNGTSVINVNFRFICRNHKFVDLGVLIFTNAAG